MIYIDESIWPYRNALYCHCMVDRNQPIQVLHTFMQAIGMKKRWFQNKQSALAHYDLSPRMRKAALAAGAIEVDAATMIMKCRRGKRPMSPKPQLIREDVHIARLKEDWQDRSGPTTGSRVNMVQPRMYCPDVVCDTSYELDAISNRDDYLFNRFFKIKVTAELIPIEADDMEWGLIFAPYQLVDGDDDSNTQVVLYTEHEWARDLLDTAATTYGLGGEGRLRLHRGHERGYARPVPSDMINTIISDYGLSGTIQKLTLTFPYGHYRWWPSK